MKKWEGKKVKVPRLDIHLLGKPTYGLVTMACDCGCEQLSAKFFTAQHKFLGSRWFSVRDAVLFDEEICGHPLTKIFK